MFFPKRQTTMKAMRPKQSANRGYCKADYQKMARIYASFCVAKELEKAVLLFDSALRSYIKGAAQHEQG
ncbi:MAG: hypothetical protein LBI54_01985 [Lachnospiraceae bacterium]|jgi:hypothetical protein|nr:hypothetical protein [Lachnospiraceae bacterium]